MIVKALLVVPAAAFHLSVVARRSWTYELVLNAELLAEGVHGMDAVRLPCVSELRAIVGLDDCRNVLEEKDGPSDEIAGGGTALLHVGVDEALAHSLVDHRILVEFLPVLTGIAGSRDVFDIHLPFDAQGSGSIIGHRDMFFLRAGSFSGAQAKAYEETAQGAGMAVVALFTVQLPPEFRTGYVRRTPDKISDPLDFLQGMRIGMRRMGAVRTIHKATGRTVVALVPAKERRFGNLVSSANERDFMFRTIKFHSMDAGVKFVWQITLDWCYNGHAIKSPFLCFLPITS